jgi:hypothetical protein
MTRAAAPELDMDHAAAVAEAWAVLHGGALLDAVVADLPATPRAFPVAPVVVEATRAPLPWRPILAGQRGGGAGGGGPGFGRA